MAAICAAPAALPDSYSAQEPSKLKLICKIVADTVDLLVDLVIALSGLV